MNKNKKLIIVLLIISEHLLSVTMKHFSAILTSADKIIRILLIFRLENCVLNLNTFVNWMELLLWNRKKAILQRQTVLQVTWFRYTERKRHIRYSQAVVSSEDCICAKQDIASMQTATVLPISFEKRFRMHGINAKISNFWQHLLLSDLKA